LEPNRCRLPPAWQEAEGVHKAKSQPPFLFVSAFGRKPYAAYALHLAQVLTRTAARSEHSGGLFLFLFRSQICS
jgi:hypothetical protein